MSDFLEWQSLKRNLVNFHSDSLITKLTLRCSIILTAPRNSLLSQLNIELSFYDDE